MNENDEYLQNNFKINDFVNSEEFEVILEVLEKELASQPDDKNDGEGGNKDNSTESTELGDVLKYLDTISTMSANRVIDDEEEDEGPLDLAGFAGLGFNLPTPSQMRSTTTGSSGTSSSTSGSGNNNPLSLLPPVPPTTRSQPPTTATTNANTTPTAITQTQEKEKPYIPRVRKVIETILDDDEDSSGDDEDGSVIKRRNKNWKSSRALLKAGPTGPTGPTGNNTNTGSTTDGGITGSGEQGHSQGTSWGAGGQQTGNTAAGLLLRKKQEKCKCI